VAADDSMPRRIFPHKSNSHDRLKPVCQMLKDCPWRAGKVESESLI